MSRPPIPWSAADLLDLARAAKALGALSFQLAERFGPDDGLELSCRATAALLAADDALTPVGRRFVTGMADAAASDA